MMVLTQLQAEKVRVHKELATRYPFYFNIDQSLDHFKPRVFYKGDRFFALGARRQFVEVTENDVRWLTPAECAELMNLDLNVFTTASDAQKYRAIGNSIDTYMFSQLDFNLEEDDKVAELCGGVCAFSQYYNHKPHEYADIEPIGKHVSEYYGVENLGDINLIERLESNVIILGSPCTSYSLAGKREGGKEGSGTKSSLMWNLPRIIEQNDHVNKFIFENVESITHKNNKEVLDAFKERLAGQGFILREYHVESVKTTRKRYFLIGER